MQLTVGKTITNQLLSEINKYGSLIHESETGSSVCFRIGNDWLCIFKPKNNACDLHSSMVAALECRYAEIYKLYQCELFVCAQTKVLLSGSL